MNAVCGILSLSDCGFTDFANGSKLPLPQLQLLLGDCGECLDAQRGKELMLVHNDHQRVMASLLTYVTSLAVLSCIPLFFVRQGL
jgi:hypothetical protein